MKSERVIALILTALAILLAFSMNAPQAHASLVLGPLNPQLVNATKSLSAVATTTTTITTSVINGSNLVTSPYLALTNTPLSYAKRQQRLLDLQIQIANLRALIAALNR